MAEKTMTLGNASNTVNLTANGNVVGVNIKSKGSGTQPIYFDANGVAQNTTYKLEASVPSNAKFTDNDTKNTAGSTNSSSKLFLIGATSQAANPQTYSHDTAYVGTDGLLYSGSNKVLTVAGGDVTGPINMTSNTAILTLRNNYGLKSYLANGTDSAYLVYMGTDNTVNIADNRATKVNGALTVNNTTESSSMTTGALKVSGGVGVAKRLSADNILIKDKVNLVYNATNECLDFIFS